MVDDYQAPKNNEAADVQFSDIEKAGMAYFMPKLLKSASCPSHIKEASPTTYQR